MSSGEEDNQLLRKQLLSIVSISLTVLLMYLVISSVGLDELITAVRNANPLFILLAFLWAQLLNLPGVFKLQGLLRAQGYRVPFFYLFRVYHIGVFFNHFLPSNVGGDFVRAYEIGKTTHDPATSLAAVFVERLTGFIVLVIFAVIALVTRIALVENPLLTLAVLGVTFGLIMIVWLAVDKRLIVWFERVLPKPLHKYLAKFGKFQTSLYRYQNQPRALLRALWWSLLFNAGAIVYSWLTALAFHQPISLLDLATIIPLTMVVAIVPLSFNGIGLQEWAFVLLFPLIGVPASVGLSAMLTIRLITLSTALLGGVFYLHKQFRREAAIA